ncbi:hypothetical protein CU044_2125 [Streptomyces sp. L-9-10]|uniref:hypothetical protein n=1 Tax=Streptomyces sp. L-9-10 TaxID=1478131 RepID=UPI00101CBAC2|nr:hypothetical protein [Streptomyces sp. L-9-10]RYJ29384.1 hypothetical protein CU044_2125 [Streptomyces sp. L-9-10]
MTDLPYTDADLRAEAIAQHRELTDDPEYFTVGEAMCDAKVPSSATGETWETLLDEDGYNAAQRKIHDLISGAANVSEWAVNLGADGLEPEDQAITIGADEKPIARVHFAFEPGMPDEMRIALVEGIGEAIADHL